MTLATTQDLVADLKKGRMIILMDEEDRENEGDLVLAADFITSDAINFMARYGRGLICLALTQAHCERLRLPLMTQNNGTHYGTAFTVSIEAAQGITTGISAADRARSIQAAVAPGANAEDIVQPGHIFPVMAQPGGVLVRAGHTEAGCDLTKLAGLSPAAVICEILREDGTMARLPDLVEFGCAHQLKVGTISDLIRYRSRTEALVERIGQRTLHTAYGQFEAILYRDTPSHGLHLALVRGALCGEQENALVYIQDTVSLMDLLDHSAHTDAWTLNAALEAIGQHHGSTEVIVLLDCARSQGHLLAMFQSLDIQRQPHAVPTQKRLIDTKMHDIDAHILRDIGVRKMQLLSDQRPVNRMTEYGIKMTGFILKSGTIIPMDSIFPTL